MRKTRLFVRPCEFEPRVLAPMAARMARGMDPLGALPSGSDSDADSDESAVGGGREDRARESDRVEDRLRGTPQARDEDRPDAGGDKGRRRRRRELGLVARLARRRSRYDDWGGASRGDERGLGAGVREFHRGGGGARREARARERGSDARRRWRRDAGARPAKRSARREREDDKASRTLGEKRRETRGRAFGGGKDWVQEEKRALREGTGGAFGFD